MSTATDFQDLIDALETNLQLMGVDDAEFDRSTGILGLVDRITDIEPSTNIDLDITCTLSSSENSIDYGESIVLTATLLASYDDTSANNVDLKTGEITGATIQFKQGNTVIGTGITNNNGVATLTYTPTTTGTLNITAKFNGTINFNRATSTGINVTVNETLTLTSDKTILSAADNESATLTATLHAANSNGQTVTFEVRKVSDDSLVETLYGTTNSSGVTTVSYLGKGTGDLYIKCFSSDRIIFSKTYTLQDCPVYDTLTSNKNRFVGGASNTSYTSDGYGLTGNSNWTPTYYDYEMSQDMSIEFDFNSTQEAQTSSATGYTSIFTALKPSSTPSDTSIIQLSFGKNNIYDEIGQTKYTQLTDVTHIKYEISNNQIKVYANDTLVYTSSTSSNTFYWYWWAGGNRIFRIKNLKIKPL